MLYGDPDLKPEKINTIELGADLSLEKHSLRMAVFSLSTDDMISRSATYVAGDVPAVTLLETRSAVTTPTRAVQL